MQASNFYPSAGRWFFIAMALACMGFAGCSLLSPGPKTIQVPQAVLQKLIDKQFPHTSSLLDLLNVQATNPRLQLDAVNNRINTALDLGVTTRGLAALLTNKDMQGVLDMSYGLRFEPSDNTVRMTDVRVSNLQIKGAPEQLQNTLNQLGPVLAERVLNDYSLYKLSEKDLSAAKGWGYKPGAISVDANGLNITLEPVMY